MAEPTHEELIEFLKNPKNVDKIRQTMGKSNSDVNTPQIQLSEDATIEEATSQFNKALKDMASQFNTKLAAKDQDIQEKLTETQKQALLKEATAFGKKHPLFEQALKGEQKELLADINSFINSGASIEDSYNKALKANGIDEVKFLADQKKADSPPETETSTAPISQQATAEKGTRSPDPSTLKNPKFKNAQDATKAALADMSKGKTLEELGIGNG